MVTLSVKTRVTSVTSPRKKLYHTDQRNSFSDAFLTSINELQYNVIEAAAETPESYWEYHASWSDSRLIYLSMFRSHTVTSPDSESSCSRHNPKTIFTYRLVENEKFRVRRNVIIFPNREGKFHGASQKKILSYTYTCPLYCFNIQKGHH